MDDYLRGNNNSIQGYGGREAPHGDAAKLNLSWAMLVHSFQFAERSKHIPDENGRPATVESSCA
jgi:hypothetical protein